MRIDAETLRDLEILGTSTGAPGLLDHLNRTRTRGGREAFRRRLVKPLASAAEIRAVQHSLVYITAQRESFNALPADARLAELIRYIDSRLTTLSSVAGPAASVESWWVCLRYPDVYQEARRGTRMVADFLLQVRKLLEGLDQPPALLETCVRESSALLQSRPLQMLQARRPRFSGPVRVFLLDHAARHAGRTAIRRLIEIVGEIDALVSMSDVTAEKGFAYPVVEDDFRGMEVQELFHPFLERPTVNDLQLPPGVRLLFLTGPNMAGKSTYLKACGVAVLLAQTGMGVPASACRLGVIDQLVTAIRTEDNLRAGVSYFQAEARRVRDIAQVLLQTRRCLVIADELFRGTNVKDACDASLSVLNAFAGAANGHFLVASHLIELADSIEQLPGVVLRRFEAALTDQSVDFDYRIHAGVSTQRLGMKVLEKEGVLELLAALQAAPEAGQGTAPAGHSPGL
jgi:DNA mismatch repair ATPase MutS